MPNVIVAASLPAAPERLYEMYLDPNEHGAFTGQPVTIAARAGAPFSAFGGMLSGTVLHVQPKRLIAQSWRSGKWPAEAPDSILVLTFHPEGSGGRIELAHLNVPESDFGGVSEGWPKYYFAPWRAYLEKAKKE